MEEKSFFNGRWKVVEEIGKGSTGTVYKVINSRGGVKSYSAIKEILLPKGKKEILNMYSQGATDSDIEEYFENKANEWIAKEVNFLEQFKGNPNIVAIEDHDVLEREDMIGRIVIIRMELLETLEDYVLNNEITDKEILKMALSILNALVDCEERNIIHRDIKPENVFVNKNKIFKLGDFSESKEIEKTVSNMTQRGTPNYMAPELYKGERGSKSIDTYSLGIMLYQYFNNNRLPFMPDKYKFEDAQKVLERRMNGEELPNPKNASEELARIILKACSYKPEDRYKSAMEFKEELQKIYDSIKTPTILFKTHGSNNKTEEKNNKTVGIYNEEVEKPIKKKANSKVQFGEEIKEEKKEDKSEKKSIKTKIDIEEPIKQEKGLNETVGIFYDSSNNAPKTKKTTSKKKQYGTVEEVKEEEKTNKKESKENEYEFNPEDWPEDILIKEEGNVEYHKVGILNYIVPKFYTPNTHYEYGNIILDYRIEACPDNAILPEHTKNEELFVYHWDAKLYHEYEFVRKFEYNINGVLWHCYEYYDNTVKYVVRYYAKKVKKMIYFIKLHYYYNPTSKTQQPWHEYQVLFSLYILNSLKFDDKITIIDKNISEATKIRSIDKNGIIKLERYLSMVRKSRGERHDGFWIFIMLLGLGIICFTGLWPLGAIMLFGAAYMADR